MDFILGLTAFVCLAVGAVLAFLFRRLIAGPKSLPVSVDRINYLSIARYRPMERLLSEEDYRFRPASRASIAGCCDAYGRRGGRFSADTSLFEPRCQFGGSRVAAHDDVFRPGPSGSGANPL